MLANIFNPRKRAAKREFEIAIRYLLHDAESVVPLLEEMYKDKWTGFIDDILEGARPYEEATAVIGIFLQQSYRNQDQQKRDAVIDCIAANNLAMPSNFLRIITQVCYFLYLAEQDGVVREKLWVTWLNDLSKLFTESGRLSQDQCITYLVTLMHQYRDEKLKALGVQH